MKKLIGIAAVVLLMTNTVFAKNPGLEIRVKEKEILLVQLEDIQKGSFLFLKDSTGEILFRNNLEDGTYETTFDFEVIPVGVYFLTFDNGQLLRTTTIEKTSAGLEVKKKPEVVFKPCFKVEGNNVMVFLTNINEDITFLKVYDTRGNLVGETRDKNNTFTRTLDFSAMPSGEYIISLRTGDNVFEHKVNLG